MAIIIILVQTPKICNILQILWMSGYKRQDIHIVDRLDQVEYLVRNDTDNFYCILNNVYDNVIFTAGPKEFEQKLIQSNVKLLVDDSNKIIIAHSSSILGYLAGEEIPPYNSFIHNIVGIVELHTDHHSYIYHDAIKNWAFDKNGKVYNTNNNNSPIMLYFTNQINRANYNYFVNILYPTIDTSRHSSKDNIIKLLIFIIVILFILVTLVRIALKKSGKISTFKNTNKVDTR